MESWETVPTGGWVVILAALWLGGLAGFAVGRRRGLAQGFQQGMRFAPLQIRHDSWLQGRCLICRAQPGEGIGAEHPELPQDGTGLGEPCTPADSGGP